MFLDFRTVSHKYEKKIDLGFIIPDEEQIKRLHAINLEIYRDIVTTCEKYGIKVSLSGGSALGAVRHKGIIPWDDDIDVMLSREDFEQFMRLFQKELGEKYYMACPDARYSDQYDYVIRIINKETIFGDFFDKSKLFSQGITVDVLPIDYVPDNPIVYYIKGILSCILLFFINSNMMYYCKNDKTKKLYTQAIFPAIYYYARISLGFIISFIPYQKWCYIFNYVISSKKKTKRVSIPSGRNHYFKETHSSDVFYPFAETEFEGEIAYVPHKVDEYLQALYGKHYMEIPPENKREKHICSELKL